MIATIRNSALLLTAAGLLGLASCKKEEAANATVTKEAQLEVSEASRPTEADLKDMATTTALAAQLEASARVGTATTADQTSNCGPYTIKLVSVVRNISCGDTTYTWKWSVKNPNPGNGYCGTIQDLDWWATRLDNCPGNGGAKLCNVVSAAVSSNNCNWYCFNASYYYSNGYVIFPYGTCGSNTTYYRLTLNKNFDWAKNAGAYFNSGCKTGQGCTCHTGIGCEEPPTSGGGDIGSGGD